MVLGSNHLERLPGRGVKMNKSNSLKIVSALLLALVSFVPQSSAQGAPTLTWSYVVQPDGTNTNTRAMGISTYELAIDNSNNIYASYIRLSATSNDHGAIVSLSRLGALRWNHLDVQTGANVYLTPMNVDLAGRVIYTKLTSTDNIPIVRNPNTGAIVSVGPDLVDLSPSLSESRSIDSVVNGTGSINYLVVGPNRIVRLNDTMGTSGGYNVGSPQANPQTIYTDTNGFSYVMTGTGAANELNKINTTTGANVGGTTVPGTDELAGADRLVRKGQANTSLLYRVNPENSVPSTTITYDSWNVTSFGLITSAQAITPNQIYDGGFQDTNTESFDVDGSDNFLACGSYSAGGETRGWFARILTSNNTMAWNVTLDLGTFTTVSRCLVDYNGDAVITIDSQSSGAPSATSPNRRFEVRKYSGGGFVGPAPRPGVTIEDGDGGPSTGTNLLTNIVDFVGNAWGFDPSWLFGLAVVGMCVWPVKDSGPLVIAIMGFIGMGISVALDLFAEWVLFVVIFLIIAVAGHRMFNRGDDN